MILLYILYKIYPNYGLGKFVLFNLKYNIC